MTDERITKEVEILKAFKQNHYILRQQFLTEEKELYNISNKIKRHQKNHIELLNKTKMLREEKKSVEQCLKEQKETLIKAKQDLKKVEQYLKERKETLIEFDQNLAKKEEYLKKREDTLKQNEEAMTRIERDITRDNPETISQFENANKSLKRQKIDSDIDENLLTCTETLEPVFAHTGDCLPAFLSIQSTTRQIIHPCLATGDYNDLPSMREYKTTINNNILWDQCNEGLKKNIHTECDRIYFHFFSIWPVPRKTIMYAVVKEMLLDYHSNYVREHIKQNTTDFEPEFNFIDMIRHPCVRTITQIHKWEQDNHNPIKTVVHDFLISLINKLSIF